jgi:hypothetical protein
MPLYSSKNLTNNNHGTRKNLTKCGFSLPIEEMPRQNPSYQAISITKARERTSKSSAPLHFIKQDRNHIKRKRDSEFAQEGRKFQPSRPLVNVYAIIIVLCIS